MRLLRGDQGGVEVGEMPEWEVVGSLLSWLRRPRPTDAPARLIEDACRLAHLKAGWDGRDSLAPHPDGVRWLYSMVRDCLPPELYPRMDARRTGEVYLWWPAHDTLVQRWLDVELPERMGDWYDTEADDVPRLDLADPGSRS